MKSSMRAIIKGSIGHSRLHVAKLTTSSPNPGYADSMGTISIRKAQPPYPSTIGVTFVCEDQHVRLMTRENDFRDSEI